MYFCSLLSQTTFNYVHIRTAQYIKPAQKLHGYPQLTRANNICSPSSQTDR